jgi:hypothetical protein
MATGNQRRLSITPPSHNPTLKHPYPSFLLHLMIELQNDTLDFSFPDLHPDAHCTVSFQRTLRIPDDDKTWPLPPGLGRFPMVHADDFAAKLPPNWKEHGGVAFPMYQSEAMWIAFSGDDYPFAVKIAAVKIDAGIFDRTRASAQLNLLMHSILGARMTFKHSHGRSPDVVKVSFGG